MKRANGDGSIYYEENRKKFCAAITDDKGKRVRKRFDTKAEASKWLKGILADLVRDEYVEPNRITLIEWLMDYIEIYKKPNVKPNTLRRYLQYANMILPIGAIKLQDITAYRINRFYKTLDSYSSQVKGALNTLIKGCLKKAYVNDMIKKDVSELIDSPKQIKSNIEIYSDEDLAKLSITCAKSKKWNAVFLVAINTGMRKGEILGLKIDQVFEDHIFVTNNLQSVYGQVVDSTTKTYSSRRIVPINGKVYSALLNCIGDRTEGYVILNRNGDPLRPVSFNRDWDNCLKRAGVPKKRFHALRHTFATKLLGSGVPVANVSKILGHSSPAITYSVYAHAVPDIDKTLPKTIENLMDF